MATTWLRAAERLKYAGTEIKRDGEAHLILHEEGILGVIKG